MKTIKYTFLFLFTTALASAQDAAKPANPPADYDQVAIYKTVDGTELPLYIYFPKDHTPEAKAAAIVFYFGGGWNSGFPSQFEQHCKYLTNRGMVAITVEYRVRSRHNVKVERCISDARSAMRWVRGQADQLGIDADRIASGGGSAGGHLAAMVALTDEFDDPQEDHKIRATPDAMVLFNPVMLLAPHHSLPKAINARLEEGSERLLNRFEGPAQRAHPYAFAEKTQPPCIMFFGTADRLLQGAEAFREASTAAGNRCEIKTWPDQGHGFFNAGREDGKYFRLTVAEMDRFLVSVGFLDS